MITVKEAINSGSWLHCEKIDNLFKVNQFRLKIRSFEKIDLIDIDEPEEIVDFDGNGDLWLMEIEIINLNKEPTDTRDSVRKLKLIDNDGFEFPKFNDNHLEYLSKFSRTKGLDRFWSTTLLPKIKASGSIIFHLPEDEDAEYFIAFDDDGIVQEV
jgi:hypothetical protein